MKRLIMLVLLGILAGNLFAAEPLCVMASTSLLQCIVTAIGGDRVHVETVIPYAMCPGHFDLSPKTAQSIAASDLFLQHGFESFARGLTFGSNGPRHVVIDVRGNGMIPSVHRQIAARVLAILIDAAPKHEVYFKTQAMAYEREIDGVEKTVQSARDQLSDVPVFAAAMIAPFVRWAGCTVVETFPRDENLSAKGMVRLLQTGQQTEIRLVIDNQQSLGRTGAKLADELGVPFIVLSNFPSPDEGGYPAALAKRLAQLRQNRVNIAFKGKQNN